MGENFELNEVFKYVSEDLKPCVSMALSILEEGFKYLFGDELNWNIFIQKLKNCTIELKSVDEDEGLADDLNQRGYHYIELDKDGDKHVFASRIVIRKDLAPELFLSAVAHELCHAMLQDPEPYVKLKDGSFISINSFDNTDRIPVNKKKPTFYSKQGFQIKSYPDPDIYCIGSGALEGSVEHFVASAMQLSGFNYYAVDSYYQAYKLSAMAQFVLGNEYLKGFVKSDPSRIQRELDRTLGEGTWYEYLAAIDEIVEAKQDEIPLLNERELEFWAQDILISYFYYDMKEDMAKSISGNNKIAEILHFARDIARFEQIMSENGGHLAGKSPLWRKKKERLNRSYVSLSIGKNPQSAKDIQYKILNAIEKMIADGKIIDANEIEYQISSTSDSLDNNLVLIWVDGELSVFESVGKAGSVDKENVYELNLKHLVTKAVESTVKKNRTHISAYASEGRKKYILVKHDTGIDIYYVNVDKDRGYATPVPMKLTDKTKLFSVERDISSRNGNEHVLQLKRIKEHTLQRVVPDL